jgi:hypothetical protein
VKKALEEAKGEVVLLEDFNAYYIEWGGVGVIYD